MKIAFFTEGQWTGTVPEDHPNMRTDLAWISMLKAYHYPIGVKEIAVDEPYDLGIVIVPKKQWDYDFTAIRTFCKKVAVMQEGPHWYWQDYDVPTQLKHLRALFECDAILVHNSHDLDYYQGIFKDKLVYKLQTLIRPACIRDLKIKSQQTRENCLIGGNFTSWYSGGDSYIVAQEFGQPIYAPSMGRKQPQEEALVTHLPYMQWKDWMYVMNDFKYCVHLMRTAAAGTFSLNAAYLGIPCIGYDTIDTQRDCHPYLTVKVGDLRTARKLAKDLANDKDYYDACSTAARDHYELGYSEQAFLQLFENFIKQL